MDAPTPTRYQAAKSWANSKLESLHRRVQPYWDKGSPDIEAAIKQDLAIERLGANNWLIVAKFYTRDKREFTRAVRIQHVELKDAVITVEAMRAAARHATAKDFVLIFAVGTSWQTIKAEEGGLQIYRYNPKVKERNKWQPIIIPRGHYNLWDPKADHIAVSNKGRSRFLFKLDEMVDDPAYRGKGVKYWITQRVAGVTGDALSSVPGVGKMAKKFGILTRESLVDEIVEIYESLHREGEYRARDQLAGWQEQDRLAEMSVSATTDDNRAAVLAAKRRRLERLEQKGLERVADWINPALSDEQRVMIEQLKTEIDQLKSM